jgi:hypothetical protein
MRSRLPSWILLLYLAVDLTNPFVPGAFRFSPEEGLVWVEVMAPDREVMTKGAAGASVYAKAPRRPAGSGDLSSRTEPVRPGRLATWLARVRTGDPPARDLPPPDSDDH